MFLEANLLLGKTEVKQVKSFFLIQTSQSLQYSNVSSQSLKEGLNIQHFSLFSPRNPIFIKHLMELMF